eukprot:3535436-Pyramimonas_sp.AAC.1
MAAQSSLDPAKEDGCGIILGQPFLPPCPPLIATMRMHSRCPLWRQAERPVTTSSRPLPRPRSLTRALHHVLSIIHRACAAVMVPDGRGSRTSAIGPNTGGP